jgi:hypothetical protein
MLIISKYNGESVPCEKCFKTETQTDNPKLSVRVSGNTSTTKFSIDFIVHKKCLTSEIVSGLHR